MMQNKKKNSLYACFKGEILNLQPMGSKKAIIAMSGGMDSAVAAFLLQSVGIHVIGLYIDLWKKVGNPYIQAFAQQQMMDVAAIAKCLNIQCIVRNYSDVFYQHVLDPFLKETMEGKTPFPCIQCNPKLKFDALLHLAKDCGADFIASGHYAQIQYSNERYFLSEAVDIAKDQSFMLFHLQQDHLQLCRFPLGQMLKSDVRKIAQKHLPKFVSEKNESFDLCFNYGMSPNCFLEAQKSFVPQSKQGNIVGIQGEILGKHKGLAFYTIGQIINHQLGSDFVLRKDLQKNQLIVGEKSKLFVHHLQLEQMHFQKTRDLVVEQGVSVKIRGKDTHHKVKELKINDLSCDIFLEEAVFAPASGQWAVLYSSGAILAGGRII